MDPVDEIKRRLDIVEYVGRTVRLQKSGRNHKGLCPFHTEKTPSFYVFPDRRTWRCFGSCGEGGDLFSFVIKRDAVEFRDALKSLAAEAGIELKAGEGVRRSRVDHLASVVSAAVDFYERQLMSDSGREARAYLERRGIGLDAVAAFHIGWAPDSWRDLRDFLGSRGFEEADGIAAGVLVQPEGGSNPYDRFRGRVIIPIADERGVFIGMGGRGLHGEEPKYLNSPQSDAFDKGSTLFGLNLAAAEIRAKGEVVVVEGYMDVIGPWQAGFKNVVASMGTSLTANHVALLKRFARKIVLAMDPDAAGLAAAERAGGVLLGVDDPRQAISAIRTAEAVADSSAVELFVAQMPDGKDPDEVAREAPGAWAEAISGAVPYAEFIIERLVGRERPQTAAEARRAIDRVAPVLLSARASIDFGVYVGRVARFLRLPEGVILDHLRERWKRPQSSERPLRPQRDPTPAESRLLRVLLDHPELRTQLLNFPVEFFSQEVDRQLFLRWKSGDLPRNDDAEDPLAARLGALLALPFPQLTERDAATWVERLPHEISREKQREFMVPVIEDLRTEEQELGPARVLELAADAWSGSHQSEEEREMAEASLDAMVLGHALHRRPGAS